MSIFEKVKELLANQLSVDADSITQESKIADDLGADSLDFVEMLMAFEEEFGVAVPDDKAQDLKTVADIVKYIEENK